MDDKSDSEVEKENDIELNSRNQELKNLTDDVIEIEKNILSEASNSVSMSSINTTDRTMFLQPSDNLEDMDVELVDDATKVELLKYDDPETEESDSENIEDLASEDILVRSDNIDNNLMRRRNLVKFSEESTDSDLDLDCPLKTQLVSKPEKDDLLENTDSLLPFTDSELAFTESDFLCTDSEINTTEKEVESIDQSVKTDFDNFILYHEEMSNSIVEVPSADDETDININYLKLQEDCNMCDKEITVDVINNIQVENFPKIVSSAEISETSIGEFVVHLSSAGEEASNAGSCTFSYSNNQASEVSRSQPTQNLSVEIDRRDLSTSSDISEDFVQVEFSESSAEASHKHRKCPDFSTLSDDVEISGEFSEDELKYSDADNYEESDLIMDTKEMIEESAIVGEVKETDADIDMAKNIVNIQLFPAAEIISNGIDSGDEGWGEDVNLSDLSVNDLETDAVSQSKEFEVVEERKRVVISEPSNEQCSELQEWLEKKEKEFDNIMEDDPESPANCLYDKEHEISTEGNELNTAHEKIMLESKLNDDVDEMNIQAEVLLQITENTLFGSSENKVDGTGDDNEEVFENVSKSLEIIDEQCVFNSTEEQLLDSNSLLITPMVITPKVKRKKISSTPKLKKKNIKSPLLRRKEIRTCINLHNACENSDVLHEIMRPAVSYGSSLNLVEAVENSPETLALEETKPISVPKTKKSSLSGKMSTPGLPWFPWKTLSFLLLISTAAIINLDCQKHGAFSKSNTGHFLRDIGQYDRVVTHYQGVVDRSRDGKQWMDTNLPIYTEEARRVGGPYYEVAQAKAGEAWALLLLSWGKLEVAVKAGVVKVEGWVPGAQEQMNKVGQAVTLGGKALWVRAQQVGVVVQQGAVDLINGDVDWVAVKAGAAERAQIVQGQLMAVYKYVQGQINQLVK